MTPVFPHRSYGLHCMWLVEKADRNARYVRILCAPHVNGTAAFRAEKLLESTARIRCAPIVPGLAFDPDLLVRIVGSLAERRARTLLASKAMAGDNRHGWARDFDPQLSALAGGFHATRLFVTFRRGKLAGPAVVARP